MSSGWAYTGNNSLEAIVNRAIGEKTASFIREHQIVLVVPSITGFTPHLSLFAFCALKKRMTIAQYEFCNAQLEETIAKKEERINKRDKMNSSIQELSARERLADEFYEGAWHALNEKEYCLWWYSKALSFFFHRTFWNTIFTNTFLKLITFVIW